jgi:hypothetical protein
MGEFADVPRIAEAHPVCVRQTMTDTMERSRTILRPIEQRSNPMSHPFPLEVEASHRRFEAMRGARQDRLAQVATTSAITGRRRIGLDGVATVAGPLRAGATDLVRSLRVFRARVAHSRGAV